MLCINRKPTQEFSMLCDGLRIWYCCGCGIGHSCDKYLIPGLGTSICFRRGKKSKNLHIFIKLSRIMHHILKLVFVGRYWKYFSHLKCMMTKFLTSVYCLYYLDHNKVIYLWTYRWLLFLLLRINAVMKWLSLYICLCKTNKRIYVNSLFNFTWINKCHR